MRLNVVHDHNQILPAKQKKSEIKKEELNNGDTYYL